ncbi:MAG: hypothetical protein ISN28_15515 [Ectothiorhodospiraceae bacterium AqS1]|nr:hypothetical protein [Ectothiorhodospiraceae bacterium AqS1]MBF2761640.1 hypothetical protein [Ectothiorhodospiraceae bacterium AqS1]
MPVHNNFEERFVSRLSGICFIGDPNDFDGWNPSDNGTTGNDYGGPDPHWTGGGHPPNKSGGGVGGDGPGVGGSEPSTPSNNSGTSPDLVDIPSNLPITVGHRPSGGYTLNDIQRSLDWVCNSLAGIAGITAAGVTSPVAGGASPYVGVAVGLAVNVECANYVTEKLNEKGIPVSGIGLVGKILGGVSSKQQSKSIDMSAPVSDHFVSQLNHAIITSWWLKKTG